MRYTDIVDLEKLNDIFLATARDYKRIPRTVDMFSYMKNSMGRNFYKYKVLSRKAATFINTKLYSGDIKNSPSLLSFHAERGVLKAKISVRNLQIEEDIIQEMLQSSEDGYDGQPTYDASKAKEVATTVLVKTFKGE